MAQSISNLPIGAKIKFGKHSVNGEQAQDIIWLIAAKSHVSTPAYPTNSITLLTERIIDVRAIDAKEQTKSGNNRDQYGNNFYPLSNISQWLNSAAESNWYAAQHLYDLPPTDENIYYAGAAYAHRPGFLYHFSQKERDAISNTTIRCVEPYPNLSSGKVDISVKVFLPSLTELMGIQTNSIDEGSQWEIQQDWKCKPTKQVVDNTTMTTAISADYAHPWWTRSPVYANGHHGWFIDQYGEKSTTDVGSGQLGIRPALNLSSALSISDKTDSDGCYTVVWNSPPPTPGKIEVRGEKGNMYAGKGAFLEWSAVTDPDGDDVRYSLYRRADETSDSVLFIQNVGTTAPVIIPADMTSIQFGVQAVDSKGGVSDIVWSSVLPVVNNNVPVIVSELTGDIGARDNEFSIPYSITDGDGHSITVTERIDNVIQRTYFYSNLDTTPTFDVKGDTWLKLTNGIHTLTITAYDGLDTVEQTIVFTKSVSWITITTSPIPYATQPGRIKLNIVRNIPVGAEFVVEVCNNGYDTEPTWEDATSSVTGNLAYVFKNTTKVHAKWGVRVRVLVDRDGAAGACYITSIGGNFE